MTVLDDVRDKRLTALLEAMSVVHAEIIAVLAALAADQS
jgi:hypothetical protein